MELEPPSLDMITKITKYLNIYDNFISKDLTINSVSFFDELELLFSKNKDILTDDEKVYIRFIIEKRNLIKKFRKIGNKNFT